MIIIRADANSSIGMGHTMRTLSIADAFSSLPTSPILPRGKADIKLVVADETVADLIRTRGYEPIILHTTYNDMEAEIEKWTCFLQAPRVGPADYSCQSQFYG